MKEKTHSSYGEISASYYSNNNSIFFGEEETNSQGGISINFGSSYISKRVDREKIEIQDRYYQDKLFSRVRMSSNQFTNLIFNTLDSNLMTPCNIEIKYVDNKLKVRPKDELKNENTLNKFSLEKERFKKLLKNIYKDTYTDLIKCKKMSQQKTLSKKEKNEIKEIVFKLIKTMKEKSSEVNELILNSVSNLQKEGSKSFSHNLKEHLLYSVPLEYRKEIKKTLSHIPDTEKNTHKEEIDNNEEENFNGLIKFSKISGENLKLVDELEAKNGIAVSLYEAIVKFDTSNNRTITPGKKLLEYQMSMSQFNEFTQNKNSSGKVCTIQELDGKIIEREEKTTPKLEKYLTRLLQVNNKNINKIEKIFKDHKELNNSSQSKNTIRKIEIDIDQLADKTIGSLIFYYKDYIKLQNKYSTDILTDTIQSFKNSKEKLANESIKKMLNKDPKETLKKLINIKEEKLKIIQEENNNSFEI